MPTILRDRGFRFFFYSNENSEPPHVHVSKDDAEAKFWLDPVREAYSEGFTKPQLRFIKEIIRDNKSLFINSYNAYFQRQANARD
jgi:hypothetical protein